ARAPLLLFSSERAAGPYEQATRPFRLRGTASHKPSPLSLWPGLHLCSHAIHPDTPWRSFARRRPARAQRALYLMERMERVVPRRRLRGTVLLILSPLSFWPDLRPCWPAILPGKP